MSDTKDETEMIQNLDLLMNMDVLENENQWALFTATGDAKDAMPSDLPDLPEDEGGAK